MLTVLVHPLCTGDMSADIQEASANMQWYTMCEHQTAAGCRRGRSSLFDVGPDSL